MILTGTYTQAGQALATRFLAGGTLTLTRIAAGSGKTSLSDAHMAREEQDLGLCSPTLEGRTALLRCTLNTTEAHASYSLTELGVYASDGDDEVLYLLYSLDQPFPVDPAARVVLRFNLEQTLADGASVTIDAPLDGLVSQEDLDEKADLVSGQVPYAQTPHLTANVTLYVDARCPTPRPPTSRPTSPSMWTPPPAVTPTPAPSRPPSKPFRPPLTHFPKTFGNTRQPSTWQKGNIRRMC